MATVATIIAIILGPIIAIQVQKLIERITHKSQAKKGLFMTLMATRDRRILPEHVRALNMIDVVFSGKGKKDKSVVEAWAEYRDHLNNYPQEPYGRQATEEEQIALKNKRDSWGLKGTELLSKLLEKMSTSLGYHFDTVLLQKGAYTPSGYGETEFQQYIIQRGLAEVLLGLKSFPIRVVEEERTQGMKRPEQALTDGSIQEKERESKPE